MLRTFVNVAYLTTRSVLRLTGLTRPARKVFGPIMGRLIFRTSGASTVPVTIMGHEMFLASADRYPPVAMINGRYEQETTKLMERVVEPGMRILDIGAHVGYFSLIAARAAGPDGKVYSFEPEPVNYSLLVENAKRNGYENIVTIQKGVSNETGTTTLYIAGLDNGRNSLYRHDLPQAGTTTVEITTIDAYLESQGWPEIDLVKVDVEGSELLVWEGMEQLRQKSSQLKLILEFNPALLRSAGIDPMQFLSMPGESGFKVEWIDEENGLLPIESVNTSELSSKLETREISVNLFCTKQ